MLKTWRVIFPAAISAASYVFIIFSNRENHFIHIQVALGLLFLCYVYLCFQLRRSKVLEVLVLGCVLRVLMFFSMPMLSDDYYRFLWDGLLLHEGKHPMIETPAKLAEEGLTKEKRLLLEGMNSPNNYSPYPPIHLGISYLSTMAYTHPKQAIFGMRILQLLAEAGVCMLLGLLLRHFSLPAGLSGLYFLHPTSILEGVGNLHAEPWVLGFLLGGFWLLFKKKWFYAGVAYALAIGTKLVPLLLIPFVLLWLWRQQSVRAARYFALGLALCLAVLFLPLAHTQLLRATESLLLYVNIYEFNAGIYFFLSFLSRHVGAPTHWIGPLVISLGGVAIAVLSFLFSRAKKESTFVISTMVLYGVYFLFATTIHPWYLIPLLGLGVLSGYHTPLLWAYIAMWSYIWYPTAGYGLTYAIISVGYLVVYFSMFMEWRYGRAGWVIARLR